jgi:hypothetical protein
MVDHDSFLRGLGATRDSGPPLILQRTDDDFVGTTLEQLRTADAYQVVLASAAGARDKDRTLRLYQPVHRTFHLVLVDAYCLQPGSPRLDPAKIDSAGMVIRRVARRRAPNAKPANPFPQGWLSVGKQLRGWQTLEDADRDPDPLRRPSPTGGHPTLAAQALERARLVDGAEQVTPLFVAPPDVCAAAGRTILFGVVPTASAEMSESAAPRISPSDFDLPGPDATSNLRSVIPRFMRKLNAPLSLGGLSRRTFSGASAAGFTDSAAVPLTAQADKDLLTEFLNFVRFLRVSLDAFGGSPDGLALLKLLAEIRLPDSQSDIDNRLGRRADEVLTQAANALVAQVPGQPTTFLMPMQWPAIDGDLGDRIYEQVKTSLAANLSAAQPGIARFDDPTARYELRAFVRVKRDDGRPPELRWTEPSERFAIVPWFENGVLPPVQIQLPDITSDNVKLLKPNVAFRLPKKLFNFLNALDPKALLDGNAQEGGSFGLDWICGFNISIIFLLAFIVMFIFLILLNIVFWWLPFIKICFPIPSFSSREDS